MRKILLVLVLLVLNYIPAQAIDGELDTTATLSFNNASFTDGVSTGSSLPDDDYYTVLIFDTELISTNSIIAILYIPKDLLANGTFDLTVLKPSKQSSSATSCNDDVAHKFELPSDDKVYVILTQASVKLTGSNSIVKGVVASSDDGAGSITISNLVEESGVISFDGNFNIHTTNSKYQAKAPAILDELDCKAILKSTTVKVTKNIGSSDASSTFSTVIIEVPDSTDEEDEFEFLALPAHPFIYKKI